MPLDTKNNKSAFEKLKCTLTYSFGFSFVFITVSSRL